MITQEQMTPPDEMAAKLIERFRQHVYYNICSLTTSKTEQLANAKQCAFIAVNLLVKEQNMWQNGQPEPVKYWQEVKKQLELL